MARVVINQNTNSCSLDVYTSVRYIVILIRCNNFVRRTINSIIYIIVTLSCSLIVMNIKHHNINIGPVNQTMDPADEEESADTADSV